ncbi:MAG: transposase zinc-binding domain-containing protein, partial [Candidatus Binatia bacterium]
MLHHVLREHLETFLEEARARGSGEGLPVFVERELREFLSCGVMARGFARFRCDGCGHEILVAFSCKGRGFCPSCCGRRMADLAAHLVDDVLGGLPVRQWVLTLPHRLRYALAWDHGLCRGVLGVFIRALLTFERRRAERRGIRQGRGGAVTAIQRFGSALNLNVHFHTLAVQGVFVDDSRGGLRFVPNPEPTDLEVAELLALVSRRITRLAKRRGIDLDHPNEEIDAMDPLATDSPFLSGVCGASVVGRIASGPRAGQPVLRIGRDSDATLVTSGGGRHAHVDGFDLHANVAVPAGDRDRLELLCGYVLRPPVAQDALQVTGDGKILLT